LPFVPRHDLVDHSHHIYRTCMNSCLSIIRGVCLGFHGLVFCFFPPPLLKTRLTVRSLATAVDSSGNWLISLPSVDNKATGRADVTATVVPAYTAWTGGNAANGSTTVVGLVGMGAGWRSTVVGFAGTEACCCGPRAGTRGFVIGVWRIADGLCVCGTGALCMTTISGLEMLGAFAGWLLFVVLVIWLAMRGSENCVP